MKVNKKAILCSAVIIGAAALLAGGTISYFTDKEETTNHFTVGDVKIEMYESQLHRENSGIQGTVAALENDPDYCNYPTATPGVNYNRTGAALTAMLTYDGLRYCTPGMDANNFEGISAVDNGHTRNEGYAQGNAKRNWGYSDATIIADAATYKNSKFGGDNEDGYFTKASAEIVPGQWIRKFTYVKNADSENQNYEGSDAYVLIRYMIPESLNGLVDLKIPGTPYEEDEDADTEGVQPYFYAVNSNGNATNKYSAYSLTNNGVDDYEGYTEIIDGTTQRVCAAVTRQPIQSGEMTFWSPVNTVRLNPNAQNTDPNGENYVSVEQLDVKVDAQAIQAKTFADAIDAINHLQ